MKKLSTMPVALNLFEKQMLFVGAGSVTKQKLVQWTGRGAVIKVVSPQIEPELSEVIGYYEDVAFIQRTFVPEDLNDVHLVHICTNHSAVNEQIEKLCKAQHIWFCRADQSHSDFSSMSLIEEGAVQIAIGSSGLAPAMTKLIKQEITAKLDFRLLERRVNLLSSLKQRLKIDVEDQKIRAHLMRQASILPIEEIEGLLTIDALYSRFKG